ncbi:polysaccharide deacetylase family protein [Alkalihalobacillus trypoxylicola]|uniref:polysaccharide deacetylase family protein n=1 Tax=Alkalihalobacillus trypoxylicola TaxID=519424 RepID=UPI0007DBF4DB|nr:polysaccharide deacetylase family protein [Alkalihalobacillus trypoxylicola]
MKLWIHLMIYSLIVISIGIVLFIFFSSSVDKEVAEESMIEENIKNKLEENHDRNETEKSVNDEEQQQKENAESDIDTMLNELKNLKENFDIERYSDVKAEQWGEFVTGVKTKLQTNDQVIALTFDACGGSHGHLYDGELIDFLREENIAATLFINERWISANKEIFLELVKDPLFEIQNHGTDHLPLSIEGKEAWGIKGTESVEGIIEEVLHNQMAITELTGEPPAYFRAGTAFYDEVAVQIVEELGLEVVNYSILGDAGATFSSAQVEKSLLEAEAGDIALLHMNQPNSETFEGVKAAIPQLKELGFEFVQLSEYPLQ